MSKKRLTINELAEATGLPSVVIRQLREAGEVDIASAKKLSKPKDLAEESGLPLATVMRLIQQGKVRYLGRSGAMDVTGLSEAKGSALSRLEGDEPSYKPVKKLPKKYLKSLRPKTLAKLIDEGKVDLLDLLEYGLAVLCPAQKH